MRKFFLFSFFILFFTPLTSVAANSHLLITEIQIEGETSSQDFIKIYNPQDTSLNISGYKIRKRSSTGKEYSVRALPKGSEIAPYGYFLWANSKGNYSEKIGSNVKSTATISKNNSIALFDNEKNIIDSLCWGKSQTPFKEGNCFPENPSKNQKLERIKINNKYQDTNNNESDFKLNPLSENPLNSPSTENSQEEITTSQATSQTTSPNSSPVARAGNDVFMQSGEEITFDGSRSFDPDKDTLSFSWNFGDGETSNLTSPTHTYEFPGQYIITLEVSDGKEKSSDKLIANILAKGVILNEILPNSAEKKGWVEILNTNSFIVDISHWEIQDNSGKTFPLPNSSFIMPRQFLVFKNTTTGLSFSNKGGSISFLYPSKVLIEKVNYPKINGSFSIAKDSKGDFLFSSILTPGLPNLFPVSPENLSQETSKLEKTAKNNQTKTEAKISPPLASSLSSSNFHPPSKKKTFDVQKMQASLKNSLSNIPFILIAILSSLLFGLIILILKRRVLDRI